MKSTIALLLALSLGLTNSTSSAASKAASKGFDGIECGKPIRESLIGRSSLGGTAEATQRRYKKIHLKFLGGDEAEQGTLLSVLSICGDTYYTLLRNEKITDALEIKGQDRTKLAKCKQGGKALPREVTVLGDVNAVERAWTVDYAKGKFHELGISDLKCETLDGPG